VITLRGELDLANKELLEDAVGEALAARPRRVVLDLSELDYLDSTGLAVLIAAKRRVDDGSCELRVVPGTGTVARLFAMTGIGRHLPLA
jgi:anti-sigma B factor antagonist